MLRSAIRSLLRRRIAYDIARSATDEAIASTGLHYPCEFMEFIYELIRPATCRVKAVKNAPGSTPTAARFDKLLAVLAQGVHPIQLSAASTVARYADRLRADLRPFEKYTVTDVGDHFRMSSSLGSKGRILDSIVRVCRSQAILEFGTAYGVSSFFLLAAQRQCGIAPRLVTVEGFAPMMELSARFLGDLFGDGVEPLHGMTDQMRDVVAGTPGGFDLFFHDADHSGLSYVNDFTRLLPALRPGAIVVFDDIRWKRDPLAKPQSSAPMDCHAGWIQVTEHPRVRRAVEVDRSVGIVLLD